MKSILMAIFLGISTLMCVTPITAESVVVVMEEPPSEIQEVIPARPSSTHVWIHGHWGWHEASWGWVPGYWTLPPSKGAYWVHGHWNRSSHGWVWVEGHWR